MIILHSCLHGSYNADNKNVQTSKMLCNFALSVIIKRHFVQAYTIGSLPPSSPGFVLLSATLNLELLH